MPEPKAANEYDFIDPLLLQIGGKFPWADSAAVEVSYRVAAASTAARSAVQTLLASMGYERAAGKVGVLRSLYFALDQRMGQHEIGKNMNMPSASITYLVDVLAKDDLVVRSPHLSDRRSAWVELTPKGRETFESIAPALTELQMSFSKDFTAEERALFAQFLIRFRKNAAEFRPTKRRL